MNTRPLNPRESKNLAVLNASGCDSVLLFLTGTGLQKSILDATDPMRRMLATSGIHDYVRQLQGQDNKVVKTGVILEDSASHQTTVSLYRPVTKKGDPRLWFSAFNRFVSPEDVCAVFVRNGTIHLLNLTRSDAANLVAQRTDIQITRFLRDADFANNAISNELLKRLKDVAAAGPLKAVCEGDTAVGRSIETALGIPINSSRHPDYKGIELKSGRSGNRRAPTRSTLFACVPDWDISALKSSAEILNRFGYQRDNAFKLYCTVSTRNANSQGLQLRMDEALPWLREILVSPSVEDVCVWRLDNLHARLVEKHRETFWIAAKSIRRHSAEFFLLESVTHTTRPSVEQFDRLLEDGTVTLDHLIKRIPSGRVSEKGPLFKIKPRRVPELFLGEPRHYLLP